MGVNGEEEETVILVICFVILSMIERPLMVKDDPSDAYNVALEPSGTKIERIEAMENVADVKGILWVPGSKWHGVPLRDSYG